MTRFYRMWALLGVAAALILPRLDAQANEQANDEGPALGVARVSLTNGDVTLRRGDSGDWVQATVNSPLVEGDTIATGQGSRTEVQLDYSNLIRLSANTEVTIASLGNRAYRVQVGHGIVNYSELRGGEADVDIETPHVAVRPQKNGRYRLEVLGAESVVTVRNGEAQIASPQGVETLKSGRTMVVRGTGDEVEFRTVDADPRDEWDQWNERRDDILKKSDSYRYVSRSINGAEELDGHGHWRYVSGYGYSWFPTVTVGWAPYRHGRWVWLDYYGWSWVGYEPWGWAPYHYGRWYHHAHHGWGWYPGSYHHHHHWRPALVAFFGYGSHGGFSIGAGFGYGHVGWIPLGPGEPYYPWYGRHFYGRGRHGGFNNTTIYVDNSVNIYNNYRNARHRNGVTVVDADGFSRGLVNNPRSLRDTELRRATLMRGQIPVVPARESRGRVTRASTVANGNGMLGADGARRNGFFNRQAGRREVARANPERVPFDQQRERMERSVRAFANDDGRRATGSSGAAGSNGRVARADTSGVRGSGSAVRGSVDPVDTGRSRIERGTEPASGRSGVRDSGTNAREAGRAGESPAGAGDVVTRGGVRSRPADANGGRSDDWRGFGGAGNRSRTPSAHSGSTPNRFPDRSSSRIDRSSGSRNDRGGRVERVNPSATDARGSGAPGRDRSVDSGRSTNPGRSADPGRSGPSRIERGPGPSQQQRSAPSPAPSRAPSVDRSAPRSAPSAPPDRGGSRVDRSGGGRSRTQLRGADSGFSRSGASGSSAARVSRADQGDSPGRFAPGTSSRVSSSSRGGDLSGRSSSRADSSRSSRIPSSGSGSVRGADSRVFSRGGSRGDVSRSRSVDASPSRSRSSSPSVFRGGDRGSRSSGPGFSRSGSAPSAPSRSGSIGRSGGSGRSSGGGSMSRGGSVPRGGSISRGGSGGGSIGRSSGGSSGGRSSGGGARGGGRSRGR